MAKDIGLAWLEIYSTGEVFPIQERLNGGIATVLDEAEDWASKMLEIDRHIYKVKIFDYRRKLYKVLTK